MATSSGNTRILGRSPMRTIVQTNCNLYTKVQRKTHNFFVLVETFCEKIITFSIYILILYTYINLFFYSATERKSYGPCSFSLRNSFKSRGWSFAILTKCAEVFQVHKKIRQLHKRRLYFLLKL